MVIQHLPPAEAALLNDLRLDLPALRYRVQHLRSQGWTLRAIGEPLQARRSTVRSWESHPDTSPPQPNPPLPTPPNLRAAPALATPAPRVRALRLDVPLPDQDKIRALAPLARKVRGGTPPDSPFREAKAQLEALLAVYYHRGVSCQRLADIAGVSYRAMKVRLDATPAPAPPALATAL